MKIALGWDHHGKCFKPAVEGILTKAGHEVMDLSKEAVETTDYPDAAFRVGEAVAAGKANRGLLICGSGIGMSIAANKVRGVRAGLVHNEETARLSRQHNDTNVLCIGERTAADGALMERIIQTWLTTEFDAGGRHERRVGKIIRYESDCRSPN